MISSEYLEQQRMLHAERPHYGAGLATKVFWRLVLDVTRLYQCETVLDYGCGKGAFGEWLRQHGTVLVREYDPAVEGKDEPPEPADLVVCLDVLEHIEPEHLEAVLGHLQGLARKAVFLNVSLQPAHKNLPDGRNAHLIVKPARWWLGKLLDRWDLRMFEQWKETNFLAVMVPSFAKASEGRPEC